MSPLSLIVIAFLIALVAMSFAFSGGAVIVTLPLAVIVIGTIAALETRRRVKQGTTLHEHRDQAKSSKVDFDERDQETLVSE
jgi:hypothetical protein